MEITSITTKACSDEYGMYYTEVWSYHKNSAERMKYFNEVKGNPDVVKVEFLNFRKNCTISSSRIALDKRKVVINESSSYVVG